MTSVLTGVPAWTNAPEEPDTAIRELKVALRRSVEASGRTVAEVFAVLERLVAERANEIANAIAEDGTAWPVLRYQDVASGNVSADQFALVKRRGCLVIRGHFPRQQALAWDDEVVDYVDSNGFFDAYHGSGDGFFRDTKVGPMIYPIYWSRPQMQARQSERMAVVQRFLNSLWTSEADSVHWFDGAQNVVYPDRIRRRPEGTSSGGLRYHVDCGKLDLWMKPEYQRAFRHVFDGSIEDFDPWSAAHRTRGSQ